MKFLIVGLGNIGSEYWGTRHNIGFRVVNAVAEAASADFTEERYGAVARLRFKSAELVVLKPNTFMNLSGNAVRYWLQRESIPRERLLVVADDLSLPFGSLRLKARGSHGGHNGLRDITKALGTKDYYRVRTSPRTTTPAYASASATTSLADGRWTMCSAPSRTTSWARCPPSSTGPWRSCAASASRAWMWR